MSIPDRKFSDRKNFDDNISQTANSGAKSPDAKGSDAKSPDAKSPDANIAENKSKVIVIDSGCKDYYPQICDPFAGGFDNMGFARECAPYDSQKYARRQIYGYEHDWDRYAHVCRDRAGICEICQTPIDSACSGADSSSRDFQARGSEIRSLGDRSSEARHSGSVIAVSRPESFSQDKYARDDCSNCDRFDGFAGSGRFGGNNSSRFTGLSRLPEEEFESVRFASDTRSRVIFTQNVDMNQVRLERDGEDLIVRYDENDFVRVRRAYRFPDGKCCVECISFADGKVWDAEDIKAKVRMVHGTPQNDFLKGYPASDFYDSNEVFYAGAGNDRVYAASGNDVIYGESGDDCLVGGVGDDYLLGGTGSDYLVGGSGCDSYAFYVGDGRDTIYDCETNVTSGRKDNIRFGKDIDPRKVLLKRDGEDLLIQYTDSDVVRIQCAYRYPDGRCRIETVEFDDGTKGIIDYDNARLSLFVKSADEIRGDNHTRFLCGQQSSQSYSGNEVFRTGDVGTVVCAKDGNDTVYGLNGNDVFYGGDGNDGLYSGGGNDMLDGGAGDDFLSGGSGSDKYVFNLGDGKDTILDYQPPSTVSDGSEDKILFGNGIKAEDVSFVCEKNDLLLRYSVKDSVRIKDVYFYETGSRFQIEKVEFSDGTEGRIDYETMKFKFDSPSCREDENSSDAGGASSAGSDGSAVPAVPAIPGLPAPSGRKRANEGTVPSEERMPSGNTYDGSADFGSSADFDSAVGSDSAAGSGGQSSAGQSPYSSGRASFSDASDMSDSLGSAVPQFEKFDTAIPPVSAPVSASAATPSAASASASKPSAVSEADKRLLDTAAVSVQTDEKQTGLATQTELPQTESFGSALSDRDAAKATADSPSNPPSNLPAVLPANSAEKQPSGSHLDVADSAEKSKAEILNVAVDNIASANAVSASAASENIVSANIAAENIASAAAVSASDKTENVKSGSDMPASAAKPVVSCPSKAGLAFFARYAELAGILKKMPCEGADFSADSSADSVADPGNIWGNRSGTCAEKTGIEGIGIEEFDAEKSVAERLQIPQDETEIADLEKAGVGKTDIVKAGIVKAGIASEKICDASDDFCNAFVSRLVDLVIQETAGISGAKASESSRFADFSAKNIPQPQLWSN